MGSPGSFIARASRVRIRPILTLNREFSHSSERMSLTVEVVEDRHPPLFDRDSVALRRR